ncbi:hypothetical protein [Corynebacterium ulceribovis]|uniref:hypothetical protein n=1 Tax=Corynebacterium ulceribovis TaxID=487732 RepID=UPI00038104CB|nr:hypothetical protein [Corynebacterium ulceribovis]
MSDFALLSSAATLPVSTVLASMLAAVGAHIPFRGRSLRTRLRRSPQCLTVGIDIVSQEPRGLPVTVALSLFDELGDVVAESALHIGSTVVRPTEWERGYLSEVNTAGAPTSGRAALLLSVDPRSVVAARAFAELGPEETWQHIIALTQHHFQSAGFGTRVLSPTEVALAAAQPVVWSVQRHCHRSAITPRFRTEVATFGVEPVVPAAPMLVLGLDSAGVVVGVRPLIDPVARLCAPQAELERCAAGLLALGWTVGIRVQRLDKWRDFVHSAAGRAWFFHDSRRPCDVVLVDVGAPHPAGCCVWEVAELPFPGSADAEETVAVDARVPITVIVQGALWKVVRAQGPELVSTGVLPLPSLSKDVRHIKQS